MINKRFIKEFTYPDYNDKDFFEKIYKKREYYYYKVQKRKILTDYKEIQKYRSDNCKINEKEPTEQQSIIPNYISPNTPYKGILLMHGVGTGKTMTALRVAEQFKEQVKKYNTKIFVLVPGPNSKKNFEKELLYSTNNTYLKNINLLNQMSKKEIEQEKKNILNNVISQYYKILSYKSFHKKVLGEKISEKKIFADKKIKSSYTKDESGQYIRNIIVDKITHMNNSIIIVDEAHNIINNEYGEALNIIKKNSENLRIILLTATPMINHAHYIVNLLNFIKPLDDQIEKDKIFTNEKNFLMMKLKSNGLDYLKKKATGLISYYRGSVPYTFAKRIDRGSLSEGLLFTPVIKCKMISFQNKIYNESTKVLQQLMNTKDKLAQNIELNDIIDKNLDNDIDEDLDNDIIEEKITNEKSSSITGFIILGNFVFPGLNREKDDLIGLYTKQDINLLISQINFDGPKLKKLINEKIFNNSLTKDEENNFIIENNKKRISGLILKLDYIKYFSIKFYHLLLNLNKLFIDNKGAHTAFIYSSFVNAGGIELFAETLIQNGYLEYNDNYYNYDIKENTIDYKTGLTYLNYKKKYNISNFKPATFLLITGSDDSSFEDIPEIKQKYIQEIFNNKDNIDGKFIKFILGSKVMNESITLKNCKEVHIIEPNFNIPRIEQVIGRAIRICVHQDVINDEYK